MNIQNKRSVSEAQPNLSESKAKSELVCVGSISHEKPTVSHLLIRHPQYGKNCWKIIKSELNHNLNYRELPEGKTIYLDPQTLELIWDGRSFKSSFAASGREPAHNSKESAREKVFTTPRTPYTMLNEPSFAPKDLSEVLKSYIGTSYNKLDCFELVVQGLRSMGICYGGKEGLQNQLIKKALAQRLPINSYLTGEGLIEHFSTQVYNKTFSDVSRPDNQAEQVFSEIESSLEKGLIVSFSTAGRGHIGVISRYDNIWTFLNSGVIDNNVQSPSKMKGVGEENLKAEIANWFRLAEEKGGHLMITLGRLNNEKLLPFVKAPFSHTSI
ncbi:MAG: hypothetical protein K8R45_05995 [Desulfobacterales bacterium]|nr:hypothetical protein [Desulfobacterales bacterium]